MNKQLPYLQVWKPPSLTCLLWRSNLSSGQQYPHPGPHFHVAMFHVLALTS